MWKNRFGSKYALHNREMMINKKYQYIMKHLACLFFKKYIYVTIAGYRNILQVLSYFVIIKGNAYYFSTDKVNGKRR